MVRGETAFRNYVEETGQLPDSVVLGHMCYFTVTEEKDHPVSLKDVEKLFAQLALNPEFVPLPNRPADAFKKATKDAERPEVGRNYPLSGGRRMNLLVRDVKSDRDKIVRHIVREVVDSENVRLAYDKVGEAIFHHAPVDTKTGKRQSAGHRLQIVLDFDKVSQEESDLLESVRKRILESYNHDCAFLDGMKLRAMVRDYVLYLNAVQLKPSLYFVHKSRADELNRLAQLLDGLNNGSGMHLVPMVDVPAQREEVIAKFEEEARASVESLLRDIRDAMTRQANVTTETYRRMRERFDAVRNKATEYTRTLGLAQETTAVLLDLAVDRMDELRAAAVDNEAEAQMKKGRAA